MLDEQQISSQYKCAKHCMGHNYTKKNIVVYLKFWFIRASCIFICQVWTHYPWDYSEVSAGSTVSQDSTEAERAPSELTYAVVGGLQCLVSWGPHFFGSCWTEGLSFWPHHMGPSIGLLTTYGLAFPSVRSKRWFKWEPLSVLSKSRKWQHILSVIFYSLERSR